MPATRELLDAAIALEKRTMALYARLAKIFESNTVLADFWFGMARDEARHVGALDLVWTVLDFERVLDRPSPIALEDSALVQLRGLLDRCEELLGRDVPIQRALEAALEIEETELEDLVGDLLKALQQKGEYERYLRLLVHDLGELSYMIEQYSPDAGLLQRCDALLERHAETLRRSGAK